MASIDEEVKTRFENNRHRFVTNLMFTSSWISNLFIDFLKAYGISPQQFNILRILRGKKDWVNMNTIKELMIFNNILEYESAVKTMISVKIKELILDANKPKSG